jgi:hypothetical protein
MMIEQAITTEDAMLKFYWNGIKDGAGKLQTCSYSVGPFCTYPEGTIVIYKRGYDSFSCGVHAAFFIKNDTDIQSDYMETDRIYVEPSHALYGQVADALAKRNAHYEQRWAKKMNKVQVSA